MIRNINRTLAILAIGSIAALTGCTSGGGNGNNGIPSGPVLGPNHGLTQQNLVAVGDSLTFGEQGDGGLGVITTSPVSAIPLPNATPPPGVVPPTQTNGWFALMYAQMNGVTLNPTLGVWNTDSILGSGQSPLPLIAAPGLGSEFVVSKQPPGFAPTHSSCDSFNQSGYSASAWASTRKNASGPIADLGVPGITMHEAVSMVAPLTGPPMPPNCNFAVIPGDPTSGGLQSLVSAESAYFYPVLGQFRGIVANPTLLNDAVYLKPQLTTVWLGANDLLKFIFSHGQSPITDSPTQFGKDLTQIITTLEKHGSKVVVANLPDILGNPGAGEIPVPQFFPASKISADMQALGVPSVLADPVQANIQSTYTQGPNGFLTESGFFAALEQVVETGTTSPVLDPSGPGSGTGGAYVDAGFAQEVIALNAGYNQVIAQVAAGTQAGLADVNTAFKGLATSGYQVAGTSCKVTLQFGGGLVSYDGLHPSNTGYALIANAFAAGAAQVGVTVPQLTPAQITGAAFGDQNNPCLIKLVDPTWPYPLP